MENKRLKRYTLESVTQMLQTALILSSNERYTSFKQLGYSMEIYRETFLKQARKYNLLEVYFQIKKNLERNIKIEVQSGFLSPRKANLMLWNFRRK